MIETALIVSVVCLVIVVLILASLIVMSMFLLNAINKRQYEIIEASYTAEQQPFSLVDEDVVNPSTFNPHEEAEHL